MGDGGAVPDSNRRFAKWPSRGQPIPAWPNGRPRAKMPGAGRRHQAMLGGTRPRTARTRLRCSWSRTAPVSPTWYPSAMAGRWSRPPPSTGVRRRSRLRTSRTRRRRVCPPNCPAMPTCRTSACSPRPERKLLFDLNDFDETLPGPFEYDVKRMAASFTIAARNNGFAKADTRASTLASVAAYRTAMAGFADMRTMDIWYAHLDEDELMAAVRGVVTETEEAGGKKKKAKARHA